MRLLPVILTFPAILLAVTGCSSSDETDATTDTETAVSDTAAETSGEASGQPDDASDSAGVFVSLVGSCETGTCDYRLSNAEGGTDVFEALAGRKSVRFEVDPEVAATYEINVRDIDGEGASCTAIITGGGFDDRQQRLTTGDGPTCSVSTSP
ncbi:MAG: hypothetical protein GY871_03580 [Actinomycetales bacterium]|nr:hypothetical protein [Actinomycetales bacterium]MCP4893825.1 hypothetical protein [Actinomycetales bacterium]